MLAELVAQPDQDPHHLQQASVSLEQFRVARDPKQRFGIYPHLPVLLPRSEHNHDSPARTKLRPLSAHVQ